ncbi:hypothetical protein MRX96_059314 [Rhipicephalus microplus]
MEYVVTKMGPSGPVTETAALERVPCSIGGGRAASNGPAGPTPQMQDDDCCAGARQRYREARSCFRPSAAAGPSAGRAGSQGHASA